MKIEIDERAATNSNPDPFFAVRIFPETNEEMSQMEWGIKCSFQPTEIRRVVNGNTFHYAIIFERENKK
jgi:hypothetical protein